METTRLSEKGQIMIPKRARETHDWEAGIEFLVEELEDRVKLKPVKPFKETTIKDVLGCTHHDGPVKTLKDMEVAIAKGAETFVTFDKMMTQKASKPTSIKFITP